MFADLIADGRLGDVETVGGTAKIQFRGDGNEVTKMAQFHGDGPEGVVAGYEEVGYPEPHRCVI